MRIIAGKWRGRPLDAPPGLATRPTADRVRETLFSMLASRLGSFEELRVADLFAGCGALGLEALSRGARSITFVENDAKAAAAIRRSAERLGATILVLTEMYHVTLEVSSGVALVLWASGFLSVVPIGLILAFQEGIKWRNMRHVGDQSLYKI